MCPRKTAPFLSGISFSDFTSNGSFFFYPPVWFIDAQTCRFVFSQTAQVRRLRFMPILSGHGLNNSHSCSLAIPGLRTLDTNWFHFQHLIKSMSACRERIAAVSGLEMPPSLSGCVTFTLQCIAYTNSGSNLCSAAGMPPRSPQGTVTVNKMKKCLTY